LMILEVVAAADTPPSSQIWSDAIGKALATGGCRSASPGHHYLRRARPGSFCRAADRTGARRTKPDELRIAAFGAAAKSAGTLNDPSFAYLAAQLSSEGPLRNRLTAAEALGRSRLSRPQLQRTAELAAAVGPLELSWLLRAFEQDTSGETGALLVQSLSQSQGLAGIAPERLGEVLKNYPAEVQSAAGRCSSERRPTMKSGARG